MSLLLFPALIFAVSGLQLFVVDPLGAKPMAQGSRYFGILDDVIDSRILSIFVLSTRHLAKFDSIIYRTYYRIEVIIENR